MKAWDHLKQIRKAQGFTSTKAKLVIRQQETIRAEEDQKLQQYIQMSLKDQREHHDLEYNHRMRLYQVELQQWKKLQSQQLVANDKTASEARLYDSTEAMDENNQENEEDQDEAAPRRRRRKKSTRSKDALLEESQEGQDGERSFRRRHETSGVAGPLEPPYVTFNEEEARSELESVMATCFRPAGAPILRFGFAWSEPITPAGSCPKVYLIVLFDRSLTRLFS